MESLLRMVAEGGTETFCEVLSLLAVAHGEGTTLSIVRASDRKVIATSERISGGALEAFVGTIPYLNRACYYARRERTNLVFRKGVACVRVKPLIFGGKTEHVAVLELRSMAPLLQKRYFDLLSVLAREYILDETLREKAESEPFGDAEACLTALRGQKGASVAVYGLCDVDLFDENVACNTSDYAVRLGKVLSEGGETPYRVGRCSYALVLDGDGIDIAEAATAWLDACYEEGLVETRLGCAASGGDARLALYLAQRGCAGAQKGEIKFVGQEEAPGKMRDREVNMEVIVDAVTVAVVEDDHTDSSLSYEGPVEDKTLYDGMEEE